MELLIGVFFFCVLIVCALPVWLALHTLFTLVPLPQWLETSITSILGMVGGLVGQGVFIQLACNRVPLRRVLSDEGGAGAVLKLAGWASASALAAIAAYLAISLLRLPEWVQQLVCGGAALACLSAVIDDAMRRTGHRLFPRLPLAHRAWQTLDVVLAVGWLIGPPVGLTLWQEGRIRGDSPVGLPHILLMFAGAGFALFFHSKLDAWLERTRGIELWPES
jgi:hypothetical protein